MPEGRNIYSTPACRDRISMITSAKHEETFSVWALFIMRAEGLNFIKNQPGDVISLLFLLLIKFLAITTQNKLQDITRCEMG